VSPESRRIPRRAVVAAGATLLASLAGCGTESPGPSPVGSGDSRTPPDSTRDGGADADTEAGTDDTTGAETAATTDANGAAGTPTQPTAGRTTTPELDLREANVTAVEFEGGDGSYDFAVTLYHDDDGEDGYANWWQVESLEGEQLGRRELLHAHSTAPFTRSGTIDVPPGTTCVVVRGHDRTHGYGGQAMLVNLDTGATRAVDQGTERASFDESDCP